MEIERIPEKCPEKSSVSELLLIGTLKFLFKFYVFLCVLSSNANPLLSIFISFYCLILLYLPHLFLSFVFSPVFISTVLILAMLLRLGSAQQEAKEALFRETEKPDSKYKDRTDLGLAQTEKDAAFSPEIEEGDAEYEAENWLGAEKGAVTEIGFVQNADFSEMFVEWDRSGPLDVIYEESEDEDDEGSQEKTTEMEHRDSGFDGMLFSSFCYPDSDSSEEEYPAWDSPENLCFRWEEREDLIEIPLGLKPAVGFEAEEENLIEINLSFGVK